MGDMPNPEDEKLTAPPDKPVDRVLPESFSDYPPSEPWILRRLFNRIDATAIFRGDEKAAIDRIERVALLEAA
jgi:hypothetical protein